MPASYTANRYIIFNPYYNVYILKKSKQLSRFGIAPVGIVQTLLLEREVVCTEHFIRLFGFEHKDFPCKKACGPMALHVAQCF